MKDRPTITLDLYKAQALLAHIDRYIDKQTPEGIKIHQGADWLEDQTNARLTELKA